MSCPIELKWRARSPKPSRVALIHRDLKPANVKVTPDDKVKVPPRRSDANLT